MKLPRRTSFDEQPFTPLQRLANTALAQFPDDLTGCVLLFDEKAERIGGACNAEPAEAVKHLVKMAVDFSLMAGAPDQVVRDGLHALIEWALSQHHMVNSPSNTDA